MENVKLSSYGPQMQLPAQQPETAETRIVKYPDEKIVHHPSPIYVKRPPTFVTINHPDIVIEPVNDQNDTIFHKLILSRKIFSESSRLSQASSCCSIANHLQTFAAKSSASSCGQTHCQTH